MVIKNIFSVYARPQLIAILALGFASGLPLALTASTLSAWLFESGVDRTNIGLFAAVATPYALKFLWAPLVDGLPIPLLTKWLGRRRGWLVATQLALMAALLLLGLSEPGAAPFATALLALAVAFFSATQDIVIDAYRVELLTPEEQGAGAAMSVLGYRFGMIAASAGALYLAQYAGWTAAYWTMAALIIVGMVAALLVGEPNFPSPLEGEGGERSEPGEGIFQHTPLPNPPPQGGRGFSAWLKRYVVEPFSEFMRRDHWLVILLFIILYKLADAFLGLMVNPFLLDIGFAKNEIASVVKIYGLAATIAGSFLGGVMVARIGMMRSLWICGVAHALTNIMFVVQARVGADIHILALGITLENVTGGMGLAAFVAYISLLTNRHFTATQYALLSSLAAFGRTWLATPAGWVSEQLGWEGFFWFAALLAVPGLIVLYWLNKKHAIYGPKAGISPL